MEYLRSAGCVADMGIIAEKRRFEAKERGWRYSEDLGWCLDVVTGPHCGARCLVLRSEWE